MKIIRHHRENGLQLMLFHIRKEDSSNHYQALVGLHTWLTLWHSRHTLRHTWLTFWCLLDTE